MPKVDLATISGAPLSVPEEPEREWPPGKTCQVCGAVVFDGHVNAHGWPVKCRRKKRK